MTTIATETTTMNQVRFHESVRTPLANRSTNLNPMNSNTPRPKLGSPVRLCVATPGVKINSKKTPSTSGSKTSSWKRTRLRNRESASKGVKSSHEKENMNTKPLPAWNDSINDLNVYKRTPEEVRYQKILHTSRYNNGAKERLEQEGIEAEELEGTLNTVLSPPTCFKVQSTEGPSSEDTTMEQLKIEDVNAPNQKLANAMDILLDQIRVYERVSNRAIISPDFQASSEPEMELVKICSRLIGCLATTEKDLCIKNEVNLRQHQDIQRVNVLLNDAIAERCELEAKLAKLNLQSQKTDPEEKPNTTQEGALAKISRRHRLLAQWRQQHEGTEG